MGDVMKESSNIAYTFVKSLMARTYPENKFFERAAIHLHVPEGATPKDGLYYSHFFFITLFFTFVI
jgi:Lon-like ATP-dependent protease